MPEAIPSDEEIHEFWNWFAQSAPLLGEKLENRALLDELDTRVSAWKLGWEVGPGTKHRNAFALSPFKDLAALELTRRIIALAPTIPHWELHPAVPPKAWTLEFQLEHDGAVIPIDARAWRYVLTEYEDGTFDITVVAASLETVELSLHEAAVDVLVDGILGEERRILVIGEVNVVLTADADVMAHSSPIAVLGRHLAQLGAT